jgi:hypothetical protein
LHIGFLADHREQHRIPAHPSHNPPLFHFHRQPANHISSDN